MAGLVQELVDGPVDVVGDVHGESAVLESLLRRLGYDAEGRHPERRRAVFVGDLIDRGPDSLAVARLVRRWCEAGRAQAVLGNHELNVLQERRRPGNEWWFGEEQRYNDQVLPQRLAGEAERAELTEWFLSLPLALEGAHLRAVHACWDEAAIAELRGGLEHALGRLEGDRRRLREEADDAGWERGSLQRDLHLQNGNPVRILTSGPEQPTEEPFVAGGRVRQTERIRWWEEYQGEPHVAFGHYWRWIEPAQRSSAGPDLFDGRPHDEPLGPAGRAWCLDFSIGRRSLERLRGRGFASALVALRLPEAVLVRAPV